MSGSRVSGLDVPGLVVLAFTRSIRHEPCVMERAGPCRSLCTGTPCQTTCMAGMEYPGYTTLGTPLPCYTLVRSRRGTPLHVARLKCAMGSNRVLRNSQMTSD